MIILSTRTFDLQGYMVLDTAPQTNFGTLSRRATRTATLDGGSSSTDLGFSWTDSVFKIVLAKLNDADLDNLKYLVQTYPLLVMSTKEGLFEGIISALSTKNYPVEFIFSPTKKLG